MHKTCFLGAPLESACHFICPILSVYGPILNRGSYMSGHVLLNLLNKPGESDKMLSKAHILSLFTNSCNKFKNTGSQMLDSIII